jgi:hypothetical protein
MKSDSVRNTPYLERYEFIISVILFAVFLAFTLPGISWGAPSIWHPDEVVYIAIHALQGQTEFDSSNFNHPHLPIYMMLGWHPHSLGQEKEVLIGARPFSCSGGNGRLSYSFPAHGI